MAAPDQVVELGVVGRPAAGALRARPRYSRSRVARLSSNPRSGTATPSSPTSRCDLPLEFDPFPGVQPEIPPRRGAGEPVRRVAEPDDAPDEQSVEPPVGEHEAVALRPRRVELAPARGAASRAPRRCRRNRSRRSAPPSSRAASADGSRASSARPAGRPAGSRAGCGPRSGVPAIAAERQVVHRQVDLALRRRAGTWADSRTGRAARHRERVMAQDPGVVLEEAQRADPGRRDVAVEVDQEKEPVVLEHQWVLGGTSPVTQSIAG